MPREIALSAPRPNPAFDVTTFGFALPRETRVTLAIYDASGRRVRVLAHGLETAGEHDATWDGRSDAGRRVAGGVFFVRLEAAGRVLMRRVARLD